MMNSSVVDLKNHQISLKREFDRIRVKAGYHTRAEMIRAWNQENPDHAPTSVYVAYTAAIGINLKWRNIFLEFLKQKIQEKTS